LHFALGQIGLPPTNGSLSSPPFFLTNGCLLRIAVTNGYFLQEASLQEAPIFTTEDSWDADR
jgi:hypothetical protein